MNSTHLTHIFTLPERSLTSRIENGEEVIVGIHIGNNNFITIHLSANANGDLDYEVVEDANPDVGFAGTYPEFFDLTAISTN